MSENMVMMLRRDGQEGISIVLKYVMLSGVLMCCCE